MKSILNLGEIYSKLTKKQILIPEINSETLSDQTKQDDGSHDRRLTVDKIFAKDNSF